ncbi:alpha/beta fold hydrolase [Mycobacteroides abscessus]|uniref:alpha/beta fold hydrolase n=1 Tax=Mycobacteroides abscessus TaxID=36809 RepID=UPI0021047A14|nr:alpha/beta hydrolase [Mycobacteroides abscessus]
MTSTAKHSLIDVNGIKLHIAEQGEGPLVILLHGFPESWYSWRHQFRPLVEAGYRVVAPDQRGYAGSEQPEDVGAYTALHLVGDVTDLVGVLGYDKAVLVGHDWGAPVAWITALLRPDLVRGVAGLSVPPFLPVGMPPLQLGLEHGTERSYLNYFQLPGVADAELAQDIGSSLRRILSHGSGDSQDGPPRAWVVPEGATLLADRQEPAVLPSWLSEDDIAAVTNSYARHGNRAFTGPLNWYRNIDRNQELLAPFKGLRVEVPGLYLTGSRDSVAAWQATKAARAAIHQTVPDLRADVTLHGAGHWIQQERPAEVSAALLDFLAQIR